MIKYLPALFLFCLIFSLPAVAQEQKHYTCYRTTDHIVPDGNLNEPDWSRAEWSDDFIDITGNPDLKPSFRTRIKLLWDDTYIYLAAELQEPDIWATIHEKDQVIFHDNDFELFLDPDGNGRNYYEIEVNALGTIWDLLLTKAYKDHGKPVSTWDLKGLKTGIHISGSLNDPSRPDTSWTIEMALPIAELMQGKKPENKPAEGVQWRVNFSRVEWKTKVRGSSYQKITDPETGKFLPEQNWVWSPMGEVSMHIPERWGRLEFSDENIRPEPARFINEKQKTGFRIWLWMGGDPAWKAAKWDSVFSELKRKGVYGVLTGADSATLLRMIPAAHKNGIIIEKWFVAMMNNDPELIKNHPDWFVINRDGKSSITDPAYVGYYRFLCPSNPEVIQYLKSSLDQYLDIKGLDGIHLDYIRYPDVILPQALWPKYGIVQDKEYAPYDYCYCKVCREKFRLQSGTDPLSMQHPESNSDWRQFRYDQVTSLVKKLSDYCHQHGKKLSAAVFPGPSVANQLVRQEWDKWPLDEVMPMLYQNFYYGNLDWIRLQTAEGVKSLDTAVPLYSGLYIPSLTPREMQSAVRKSIEGGANGICLFIYGAMTPRHWEALKEVLGR
ncbi:MAG: carbohydrate-binding family 9-like protein [Bacteroidetes bacterium]|nr:carbohydrate-binding family 9-like protein [Bacteroidota bacterium]